ncbi:hypothetical protein, partial [Leifsonia xyli]|uniref:hypothetical protein n=1 Tax=Leifsonia xyli TaxID=1575 RepID=UPI00159EF6F7
FQPKNGRKWNFLRQNGEFSLCSLRVLVLAGFPGAGMSEMMARIDLMPLEAMYLFRFLTLVFFQPKNGRKWNFLRKNEEFSLWSLRVLVLAGFQHAGMSEMMARIDLMPLEAMYLFRFLTLVFFQPKNGRKWNFLRQNGEFSLCSLRVLVLAGFPGAGMSEMMARIDLMPLEAMYLFRFLTLVFFQPKNGRKWNFLRKNEEFSLWSLRVLVLAGFQHAGMSEMMARIDLMPLEAMYLFRFLTLVFFQPKNGRKWNFLRQNGEFSLCSLRVL